MPKLVSWETVYVIWLFPLINKFLTSFLPTMISEESNLIISSNSFERDWPSNVINSPVLTSAFDIPHS